MTEKNKREREIEIVEHTFNIQKHCDAERFFIGKRKMISRPSWKR